MLRRAVLWIALAALAPAAPAGAATSISLATNSTTYLTGSVITLTVTATSNGGETDDTLFGAIVYENTKVSNNAATNSQINLPGAGWVNGALTCTTLRCVAFNYVNIIGPTAIGLTNATIATQTYTVLNVPVNTTITFSWQTSPTSSRLDWFGITNSPGITLVPEPATAALLGVGVLALSLARPRRT